MWWNRTVGTSWYWVILRFVPSASFKLWGFLFFFENRVILWVSINYPKPIHKMEIEFPSLSVNIVWRDYSVFIFSKVVSCSWRCECHRPETAIIKWTCPLLLKSGPIFDWGLFEPPSLAGRVLKKRVCLFFHPSFCLSVTFLGIGSLFFSWNLACC